MTLEKDLSVCGYVLLLFFRISSSAYHNSNSSPFLTGQFGKRLDINQIPGLLQFYCPQGFLFGASACSISISISKYYIQTKKPQL